MLSALLLKRRSTGTTTNAEPPLADQNQQADFNPGLIMVIVAAWLVVFLRLQGQPTEDVAFFSRSLKFPLFVPAFGLLGAMVFIIDVFRKGKDKPDVDVGKEFAWRLLLGPYVAIVMVLLSKSMDLGLSASDDAIAGLAVLAFFSGFLVVLVLQWLTELFHTWLGLLRAKTRYEPSRLAKELGLDKEDDLKLQNAGIKDIAQVQALVKGPDQTEIAEAAKRIALDEQFLLGLVNRCRRRDIRVMIGEQAWRALEEKTGISTIEGLAAVPHDKVKNLASGAGVDPDQLERLADRARKHFEAES